MGSKHVFTEEMVGFDPGRKEKSISSTQCGVCGSVSGLVTRLVVQPLDVLKIRFQLQIEPTSKVLLYLSERYRKFLVCFIFVFIYSTHVCKLI